MVEPMDLPAQAKRLVGRWAQGWMTDARTDDAEKTGRWTGTFLNGAIPDLEERIALALTSIRDAATAAERQRAIAIVEHQQLRPHYSEPVKWVKDQILAALRGGDHE